MALEFDRYIFNVHRPSAKSFLVSIPMYMFRLQTNKFSQRLDFFRKLVLKFKVKPGIENSTIAACTGLDESFIDRIEQSLQLGGYLSGYRILEKGLALLNEEDSIQIATNGEKELGYVFQYVDRNDFYPYYIKQIGEEPNLSSKNEIVLGTKGDGYDKTVLPYKIEIIEKAKRNQPIPNEQTVLNLISRTCYQQGDKVEHFSFSQFSEYLSLSFVPENPEPILVNVCTYIYLPEIEDNMYGSEWQILDPFTNESNNQLKFYLESFNDSNLKNTILHKFSDAQTDTKMKYAELFDFEDEETQKLLDNDFDIAYKGLDKFMKGDYLRNTVSNFVKAINYFQIRGNLSPQYASGFMVALQKALEHVLMRDKEIRPTCYQQVYEDYVTPQGSNPTIKDQYSRRRKDAIKQLLDNRIFVMDRGYRLVTLAKTLEPDNPPALKHYLCAFLYTYYYDYRYPLFNLIVSNMSKLYEIANFRNTKGHGTTEARGEANIITIEYIEETYIFFREFMNKYMKIVL